MKRDIGLISDYPTVVRPRGNMKQFSRSQFHNRAVLEGCRSCAGKHETDVFDAAAYGSDAGTDMFRPSPTRFIRGTSDRHSADTHDLESALHRLPDFIWCFKSLQYNIEHGCFPCRIHQHTRLRKELLQLRNTREMVIVVFSDEKGKIDQAHGLAETRMFRGPLDHGVINGSKFADQIVPCAAKRFQNVVYRGVIVFPLPRHAIR